MARALLAGLARRAAAMAFGEAVTVHHGASSWNVVAIVDDATAVTESGYAAQLATVPRLRLSLADVDDVVLVEDEDTVTARGQTYVIRSVIRDGAGGVLLTLRLGDE